MFYREGDVCVAHLSVEESQVLRQCAAEMAELLSDRLDRDDPVVIRLFPDVYADDAMAAQELRRLTETDLKDHKRSQVARMLVDLPPHGGEVRLDEEGAESWLRALTDLRLALAMRLDIRDDTDIESELDDAVLRDPTSSRVGRLSIYGYLSVLQQSLIESVTED
jgi:Domain of unknown function (DUF2017)